MNLCGVGMSQRSEHLRLWYRVEAARLKGEAGLGDWERSRRQLLVQPLLFSIPWPVSSHSGIPHVLGQYLNWALGRDIP